MENYIDLFLIIFLLYKFNHFLWDHRGHEDANGGTEKVAWVAGDKGYVYLFYLPFIVHDFAML